MTIRSQTIRSLCTAGLLMAAAAGADAQNCNSSPMRWSARLTSGAQSSDGQEATWVARGAIGGAVTRGLTLRGHYTRQWRPGGAPSLRTAGADMSIVAPIPFSPCIGAGALLTTGRGMNAGDQYRNLTIPLTIGRDFHFQTGPFMLQLGATAMAVYSATDASLFTYDLRRHGIGPGGSMSVGAAYAHIGVELEFRAVDLPSAVGPHALGRTALELSTIVRF